jgi:thiol-disulfide isomerase/thioredoxin
MLIQNISSYEDFINYLKNYKNIIVNISAPWCKPCMLLKPQLEKFISVVDNNNFIYLKIDHSVYEEESEFQKFFEVKKIPYFAYINNEVIIESFVNGDFPFVSKKIFDYTKDTEFNNNLDF